MASFPLAAASALMEKSQGDDIRPSNRFTRRSDIAIGQPLPVDRDNRATGLVGRPAQCESRPALMPASSNGVNPE
jgi:hypothetical protein